MSTSTVLMIIAIIVYVVMPSLQDRVIPVKKLIITPAIFMYLFYQTVNKDFNVQLTNNWIIALGFAIGIAIGILIRKNTAIKSDKQQLLIWLPGNYLSLIIFSLMFSIHFVIGYLQSVHPSYLTQTSSGEQILLFLIACISSITLGANGVLYSKYLSSESSELVFSGKRR